MKPLSPQSTPKPPHQSCAASLRSVSPGKSACLDRWPAPISRDTQPCWCSVEPWDGACCQFSPSAGSSSLFPTKATLIIHITARRAVLAESAHSTEKPWALYWTTHVQSRLEQHPRSSAPKSALALTTRLSRKLGPIHQFTISKELFPLHSVELWLVKAFLLYSQTCYACFC